MISDLAQSSTLGGNLFAYCENNAVNDSDPSGEYSEYKDLKWVAFGIQIEFSISLIALGIQFVWFVGPNYKSDNTFMYLFIDGGYSKSKGKSLKNQAVSLVKKRFLSKLKNASQLLKSWGAGLTVSVFAVFADYKFNSYKCLSGGSHCFSVTAAHILFYGTSFTYTGYKNRTGSGLCYGLGYNTSFSGYSATSSYSFYIGKFYSRILASLKNGIVSLVKKIKG